jgi:trk system potassium uptake protein TrkH
LDSPGFRACPEDCARSELERGAAVSGVTREGWAGVFRLLGDIGRVFGLLLCLLAFIALVSGEPVLVGAFGSAAAAILGIAFIIRRRLGTRDVDSWQATLALTLAWPVLSVVSALPFVAGGTPILDAVFEGVSAWTDTGLTMIEDPAGLSVSLAVFRIAIQWFSGLGIVMFMLLLRASSPKAVRSLFEAEGRPEDFSTDIWHIGRIVVRIYAGYTVAGSIALWLSGMPPVAALAHAVTSLSTGGFSTNSVGVGVYGALPSVVAMVLMLAGGISFTAHRSLLKGDFREFWACPQVRWLFTIILASTVLVMVGFRAAGEDVRETTLPGVFYVVTAVTTCGAGTSAPLSAMPASVRFVVLLLMVCGASYGSTTGALKLWRLIVVSKIVGREVRRPFYPVNTVMPIRVGQRVIPDAQAAVVAGYAMLYVIVGLAGCLVFTFFGYRPLDALFTIFSAQGNVGLNAMPSDLYYGMAPGLKVLLVLHMLVGRVEIFPLLSLARGVRKA